MIRLKRAYDPPADADGCRVLIDRIWPRGLKKADARIDKWMKELAPSTELRKWFGHDPKRWDEFRTRYGRELEAQAEAVQELRELGRRQTVTLVYAARNPDHNNAVALRDYLRTQH